MKLRKLKERMIDFNKRLEKFGELYSEIKEVNIFILLRLLIMN